MGTANGIAIQPAPVGTSTDYTRFIILSGARTGSHMLASSLNSHPQVTCFREVFNQLIDHIQYGVDGYDNFSETDRTLRQQDPRRFLRERIFPHASPARAVGFKFHYDHCFGFPGTRAALQDDTELRVIHLRRRNLLHTFVSLKFAQKTGVWRKEGTKFTQSKLRKALRHPAAAVRHARGRISAGRNKEALKPQQVMIDKADLYKFVVTAALTADHFDTIFAAHPMMTVYYEDIVESRLERYDDVQRFLGLNPERLAVNTARQHPRPLRDLISNYEDVRARFQDHPAIMLDD